MKVNIYTPKEQYKDNIVLRNPVFFTSREKVLSLYNETKINENPYGLNKINELEYTITVSFNEELYTKTLLLEDIQTNDKNVYFITELKLLWQKENYDNTTTYHYELKLILQPFYRTKFDWRKISGNIERTNHRFYTYEIGNFLDEIDDESLKNFYLIRQEDWQTIKFNTSNLYREKMKLNKTVNQNVILSHMIKNEKYFWINNNKINFSEIDNNDFINTNIIRKPKYDDVNKIYFNLLKYTTKPNEDYFIAFNIEPYNYETFKNPEDEIDRNLKYMYQQNWKDPVYFLKEIKKVTINQIGKGGYVWKDNSSIWRPNEPDWENTYSQVTMICSFIDKGNKLTFMEMTTLLPYYYEPYNYFDFDYQLQKFITQYYEIEDINVKEVLSTEPENYEYITYIPDDASGVYYLGDPRDQIPPNERKIDWKKLSREQQKRVNVDVLRNDIQRINERFLKTVNVKRYNTNKVLRFVSDVTKRKGTTKKKDQLLKHLPISNPILWFNESFIEESISSDNIIHPINNYKKHGNKSYKVLPIQRSKNNVFITENITYYTKEDVYNGKSVIEYPNDKDVMIYINSEEIISDKSISFINANKNQIELQRNINEQNLITGLFSNTLNLANTVINPTNLLMGIGNSTLGFVNTITNYTNELNRMDAKINDLQKSYDRISGTDDLNIKYNGTVYHTINLLNPSLITFFNYYYNKFGWRVDLFTNDLDFMNQNQRVYNYIKMSSVEYNDLPMIENYTKTLLLNGVWYIPEPLDNDIVNGIDFNKVLD